MSVPLSQRLNSRDGGQFHLVEREAGQTRGILPQAVESLALLALKQTGAAGYAVHEVDRQTGARSLKLAEGVSLAEAGTERFAIATYPLQSTIVSGALTFVFRGSAIPDRTHAVLDRFARAIEQVWRLSFVPESYAREAARIGTLEAELADSKIAERARGLLGDREPAEEVVETILHHVESVLRPSSIKNSLAHFGRDLEQQIAERELTSRAKAVLQDRYGFSEEQAHVHLRAISRNTRTRLREVAQAVIANPSLDQKGV